MMSDNNASVVVRIDVPIGNEHRRRSVVLCGDIEHEAIDAIMRTHPDLHADVLELPHHGSAKPGAFGFVRALDPSVVLQSTGLGRLDDPRWDGLRTDRAWYATAESGGVWVRIGRRGDISHGWSVP